MTGARGHGSRPVVGRAARPGRTGRRRLVVIAAAVLLALAFGAGLLARNGTPAAADTGSSGAGHGPLLAPAPGDVAGRVIDGISAGGSEQLAFHVHAHLAVFVNGREETIPAGIGVLPPLQIAETASGPFVIGGAGFYWLHTHDESGVIHIESPVHRAFTLGEFFDIWGQPLGRFQVGPERGMVTALVDGREFTGDPRDIPLAAHSVIQLDVGPDVPFRSYRFAAGL